jgi:integrase
LYGKLQGAYPARWLTHAEAYGALLGTCDPSDVGRRDELVLRLGLAGMRAAEVMNLTVRALQLGREPMITWIGKKDRPRKVAVGRRWGSCSVTTSTGTWRRSVGP